MHIKIVQRFPNFMTGFKPETAECSSLEELLDVPFVKRWINKPDFCKLRKVIRVCKQHILMCDLKNGKWAIAWLYGDIDQLDLST